VGCRAGPRDVEQLLDYLRTFTTWDSREGFDFGASAAVLAAILDSLRKNARDAELDELREYLDENQVNFLTQLATKVGLPND
jgi:hypothetical protein